MLLRDIERSVYSQNGEDGIIEYLLSCVDASDKTLIEIGAGSGSKNNSRRLLEQGWRGELFEKRWLAKLVEMVRSESWDAVVYGPMDSETASVVNWRPVLFSLDIDSYDYWVARELLRKGLRPRVVVVEYNAAFDPESVSVPAGSSCDFSYFGCSLEAWMKLWGWFGYTFVTVGTAGINAFFVQTESITSRERLSMIHWLPWMDCSTIASREGSYFERHDRLKRKPLKTV